MEDREMLMNTKLIVLRSTRLMMSNEMRFVMLTKLSIAMIVALFSLALPAHAQRRTPAPRQSDSKASQAVSAKALAITGKGCSAGFNEMYYSTDILDLQSNVIEFCGPAWAVAEARIDGGGGAPIKQLLLTCEQTGGLNRTFFQPDIGLIFECYYKN
jgi:hypothetical protein